jgi:hypothetical protein
MILDSTSDVLQIVLSGTVGTTQLPFYVSYSTITSTGMTINKNQGTTNNQTPVTLIPSPSSGQQIQLKQCSIFNSDTSGATVSVQYTNGLVTRTILSTALIQNESIQYNPNSGWQTYDETGILKVLGVSNNPPSLRIPPFYSVTADTSNLALTTLTATSGTDFAYYLGKADRAYNTITLRYNVQTALGATITYSELAIYKGYPTIGSATTTNTLTRCGFTNTSAIFNSTGTKNTSVTVTGITINDDIWVVFGTLTSGTNLVLAGGVVDDTFNGFIGTVTGSLQPSTNTSLTITKQYTTPTPLVIWQASQW